MELDPSPRRPPEAAAGRGVGTALHLDFRSSLDFFCLESWGHLEVEVSCIRCGKLWTDHSVGKATRGTVCVSEFHSKHQRPLIPSKAVAKLPVGCGHMETINMIYTTQELLERGNLLPPHVPGVPKSKRPRYGVLALSQTDEGPTLGSYNAGGGL